MPLSLDLFPEIDGLDGLIEQSMPWFSLGLFALAIGLGVFLIGAGLDRLRHRSPVDKCLRRRG